MEIERVWLRVFSVLCFIEETTTPVPVVTTTIAETTTLVTQQETTTQGTANFIRLCNSRNLVPLTTAL